MMTMASGMSGQSNVNAAKLTALGQMTEYGRWRLATRSSLVGLLAHLRGHFRREYKRQIPWRIAGSIGTRLAWSRGGPGVQLAGAPEEARMGPG